MFRALKSPGVPSPIPGVDISRRESMHALWKKGACYRSPRALSAFRSTNAGLDDFWQSYSVLEGPSGMAIRNMSARQIEELKMPLREYLPCGPDGRIAYESFANAVSGRVPS